jgi:polysaccharide export outer membrane protein
LNLSPQPEVRLVKTKRHFLIFVLSVVMAGLLLGCASQTATVEHDDLALATIAADPPEYVIEPGDQLDIKFFFNPELNETVTVRPDGKISVQLLDDVQAAGLTPTQLDKALTDSYAQELLKPKVTVIVRSFTGQRVYVDGEVNRPGLVDLRPGMTPLQAVINAGGIKETAKPEAAIVVRKGPDNRPIPIAVDLNDAIYGASGQAHVQLQPQDIVYVPKTAIAKANKFVNQYIEQLLLFRGASLGFSYQVHDAGKND